MKRGKRRRKPFAGHSNHKHTPVSDRRIIPVADGPLRKRAGAEYRRAMAKLEKARAELRHFEEEDRPSFASWLATTFGALLTELRENTRLAQEQQVLIDQVELEMLLNGHRNPRKAYAAVMKRRERPKEEEDFSHGEGAREASGEEEDDFDPYEQFGAEIPKEDRKALFDDFLRSVLGMIPQRMAKADYEKMFAEFEAELFGNGPEVRQFPAGGAKKPAANRNEGRIKEIYRNLVRRLHPDVRADGDATVAAIWHEVQAAYEARNLDRLETLLALTEMETGTKGAQASLSQMREALAELDRAFRAIRRSIGQAKRDPAWGFSRNPYRGPLETRIRREMEEDLEDQRRELAELKCTIDAWSRSWEAPARKPRKQAGRPEKPEARKPRREAHIPEPVQTEFSTFW
jgi:hypothetical protein